MTISLEDTTNNSATELLKQRESRINGNKGFKGNKIIDTGGFDDEQSSIISP